MTTATQLFSFEAASDAKNVTFVSPNENKSGDTTVTETSPSWMSDAVACVSKSKK
jgi:hypothetical protein